MKTQRGDGMLFFRPYFDTEHNLDGRVVRCTRRTRFTPKETPCHSFFLEAEWTPEPLNADRRKRSLENFQGLLLEIKTETFRVAAQCLNQM
jgi:hypothetical protein